jgi:hypothetical protein
VSPARHDAAGIAAFQTWAAGFRDPYSTYRRPSVRLLSHDEKKKWFEKMQDAYLVLRRLPAGLLTTVIETKARLQTLQSKGPSQAAFTFKRPYPPPNVKTDSDQTGFDGSCPTHQGRVHDLA